MDIVLKEVKQQFIQASSTIDELISNYLTKRLGVDNINTINTLTNDERGTYNDRLDLLLKVTNPTNIESGKIKVFTDLSKRFSNIKYYKNLAHLYESIPTHVHFLLVLYPQKSESSIEDKFKFATYELIEDVIAVIDHLATIRRIKIIEDDDLSLINSPFKQALSSFLRRAML